VKGVFGGNFNPVHSGHLILATDAIELLGLEKVFFIPAWESPFKDNTISVPFRDRYNMLKLATANIEFFEVLDIEGKKKGISYTYDTLKELLNKEKDLCLLIGEDQAIAFKEWYKWEEILKMVNVFVFRRSTKKQKYLKGLSSLNSRIIEISSTEIRDRIKRGKSVDFLLPGKVLSYIIKHNLYKDNT
jgi:nicotinate-nucleotide adenylyltransferase